jgi:capsular polysaccharide biosynthesis protein
VKKYYYYIVILALLAGACTYLILKLIKPTYEADGKVSVVVALTDANIQSDTTGLILYNSVAQAIASRSFAKTLYDTAGVSYDDQSFENLDKVIKASVADNSDVIDIQLLGKDRNDLAALGNSFPQAIQNSDILKTQGITIELNSVDAFYVLTNPVSSSPSEYAMIVFIAVIIIGLLVAYTFFLPEYNKFLSD